MGMTLAELQEWPPHIKALADAASKRGDASQQAADKVQAIVDMSTWQGDVNGGLELTLFRRIGIDPLVAC
ncbi:hypothetical protein [Mycobacteroides abscessus]|uniref:hypothetical protein n=1 Tax=Mycobacteroides abscessus TaxID=36809 RepID=UPI0009A68F2D|nr:hypothetical protein [Mycobacteroides abscessus]SLG13167.1 Uncharacterised protein [Mycobacteroides abscessus subsp. abscessus]